MEDDVREEGAEPTPEAEEEPTPETREGEWGGEVTAEEGTVHIETGRGQTAEVQVGSPFGESIERVADEAHYGGYFRVFLNGEEILNPEEAPDKIEAGMRIAITSYDKVG